jgi:hypothetical protein
LDHRVKADIDLLVKRSKRAIELFELLCERFSLTQKHLPLGRRLRIIRNVLERAEEAINLRREPTILLGKQIR